ncbi:hypothetical protein F5Y14DRAFT_402458 [Nemania sp. NC0429]|nr:hypothetical protein F5Y14DRAFT_402458 [Nemania sp. NC0429]
MPSPDTTRPWVMRSVYLVFLSYQYVCLEYAHLIFNLSHICAAYRGYPQTQVLLPPEANRPTTTKGFSHVVASDAAKYRKLGCIQNHLHQERRGIYAGGACGEVPPLTSFCSIREESDMNMQFIGLTSRHNLPAQLPPDIMPFDPVAVSLDSPKSTTLSYSRGFVRVIQQGEHQPQKRSTL